MINEFEHLTTIHGPDDWTRLRIEVKTESDGTRRAAFRIGDDQLLYDGGAVSPGDNHRRIGLRAAARARVWKRR